MRLVQQLRGSIDRAEIGTPLLLREGLHAAHRLHDIDAGLPLTADAKIMDAGELEADICFLAGCDIVTVLAAASDATLAGAVRSARHHGGRIMADMIALADPVGRAAQLWVLGVDIVCVHTAFDVQGTDAGPLGALVTLRAEFPDRAIAAAGGIGPDTLGPVLDLRPEIVIVGGAILNAAEPLEVASGMKRRMLAHG